MTSLPRALGCLLLCASACEFDAAGTTQDTGSGGEAADDTADDTAGTDDESGTDAGSDTGEASGSEEEETGGGASCGNGMIEQGEACDGEDLGGQACTDFGFVGGTLSCSANCTIDATGCVNEICGNGIKERGEECDGQDFGGLNCVDLGFGPGLPLCTRECTLDTSPCTTAGEGDLCSQFDPCPNDLHCVNGVCHNGSSGDPCMYDWDCQNNDCVGETLFMPGTCA